VPQQLTPPRLHSYNRVSGKVTESPEKPEQFMDRADLFSVIAWMCNYSGGGRQPKPTPSQSYLRIFSLSLT
jgi:hypothetical protein